MVQQRQLLDGQLNENKSVLEELNKLKEDKNTVSRFHFQRSSDFSLYDPIHFQVYKLMGPILVKQSITDSQQNISKRIDFINKELTKCQDQLNNLEQSQDKHRANLQTLQQQLILLK